MNLILQGRLCSRGDSEGRLFSSFRVIVLIEGWKTRAFPAFSPEQSRIGRGLDQKDMVCS